MPSVIFNFFSLQQPLSDSIDRIIYPAINEQVWKNAQNYPANFINASKSSLAFAHRNRYWYFSWWTALQIRWYPSWKDRYLPVPVTQIQCASDISSQYLCISFEKTDLVCIQCQTVFTLPEKYLDRPSTHITGKDLFLLCKITNLLIYSDIKQHQCMLKYVKRQSYKIAIARF